MLDTDLNAPLVVIDRQSVADAELVEKSKRALTRVDEITRVFPNVEANDI